MNLPWVGKGEGEERGRGRKGEGRREERRKGRAERRMEGGREEQKEKACQLMLFTRTVLFSTCRLTQNKHTYTQNNSTEEEPETDTLFISRWATNGIHIHTQYYIHNIHRSMQYNNYV